MKKKIGTILEENLIIAAKRQALSESISLSELFERALKKYLRYFEHENKKGVISRESTGSMKVSKDIVKQVMSEENYNET